MYFEFDYLIRMINVIQAMEETADRLEPQTEAPSEAIFQDPKGPRLWQRLKKAAGLASGPYELLGRGTRGAAYAIDDTRVLKVTNDRTEAVAAGLIRDNPDPRGNAQYIEQVWELRGQEMGAWAIVQERLEELDEEDPWIQFSDFWPDWSATNDYQPIMPEVMPDFFNDTESAGLVEASNPAWGQFKMWLIELAQYLAAIQLYYHDFWHRNLLRRGNQHVAIDFGYSRSEREPDIQVIAKYKALRGIQAGGNDHEMFKAALLRAGLPMPPGKELLRVRFQNSQLGDWYAQTEQGWFWFDARKKIWAPAPNGPTER